jgi:hypothetical protein
VTFSERELRDIIGGLPIGERWPYSAGSADDIDQHLAAVVTQLSRSCLLEVEADFNHYGSGYASYVPVFCYKKDRKSTTRRDDTDWIDGILVYLCRLAPVAVYGPETESRAHRSGGHHFLMPDDLGRLLQGAWEEEVREVQAKLEAAGLTIPLQSEMARPLGFEAEIPTILADGPYYVFDAIFYWED